MQRRNIILILGALALVAAACGGTSADPGSEPLPTTIADGAPNPAAGTCLEGTVDCNDTPGLFEGDEPQLGEEPGTGSSGMVVGGGLTVGDALAGRADGVIAVQGFVVENGAGAVLCELLAESMPPQCGGASIEITDLSTIDPDEFTSAQGVTWTNQPVTVFGEIVGGAFVPTALSS